MSDSHFRAQARDVVLSGAEHASDGEEMSDMEKTLEEDRAAGNGSKTNVPKFAKLTVPSQPGWHVTLGRSDRLQCGPGVDHRLSPSSIYGSWLGKTNCICK